MRYLLLMLAFIFVLGVSAQDEGYELALLHTSTVLDNHLVAADGIGGTAREATLIKQAREAYPNLLLLDMGDRFINPLYFGRNAEIMNTLGYNAMTMGNHEFNGGNAEVANLVENLDFPILAANIDTSASPLLAGRVAPYTIIELNGESIGLIGLAEEDSPSLSSPGVDLIFLLDEVAIAQSYIDELRGQGINKIIILAHREANENVVLASSLDGVDVILGGSDNVLLSNSTENAAFPYPIEAVSMSGEAVLVVQTPEGNRYLGQLVANFDAAGVLTSWSGDNILLDSSVSVDVEFATLLDELYADDVANAIEIGASEVDLIGGDPCREEECTMGNLIADALRDYGATQIGIYNAGGIRANIGAGAVTDVQVVQVLPFGNLVSTMELRGEDILVMLEHSVSLGGDASVRGSGRFLQVSGMRYSWNPTRPVGERIESVEILNADGDYVPLDVDTIYSLASNDFIRTGGDEYSMLAENAIDPFDFGPPADEVLRDYIAAHSPITVELEGRITRLGN